MTGVGEGGGSRRRGEKEGDGENGERNENKINYIPLYQ